METWRGRGPGRSTKHVDEALDQVGYLTYDQVMYKVDISFEPLPDDLLDAFEGDGNPV